MQCMLKYVATKVKLSNFSRLDKPIADGWMDAHEQVKKYGEK